MNDQLKLQYAARLVREVTAGLDLSGTSCEHCGRETFADWTARQANEQLTAAANKITRWAKSDLFEKDTK